MFGLLGAATLENSTEVSEVIKNRTMLWASNCTTRYLYKGCKHADLKATCTHNIYSSSIRNRQIRERAYMPINWWMDKENVAYIPWQGKGMKSCYMKNVYGNRMY